ncbi:hypothetical protein [Campylobacter sp. RM12176]|nr:hypothetical protein [Campylobacter sp. RM12176]
MNNSEIQNLKDGVESTSFYILDKFKIFQIDKSLMGGGYNNSYKLLKIPIFQTKSIQNGIKFRLLPFLPIRPSFKLKSKKITSYDLLDEHYKQTLMKLNSRFKNGQKIRVGFYIVEVFQYASIYEEMLKSEFFEPFIVVVPDFARKEIAIDVTNKVHDSLSSKYQAVYKGYNEQNDEYIDFSDKLDIVFFGNPYEVMVHPNHFIWHMLKKNILTCFQNYGYFAITWCRTHIASSSFWNACWRVFVDSYENYNDLIMYNIRKGANAYISGYAKMDKLASIEYKNKTRKQILLCPHHTINAKELELSNFLKYSDLFLELPQLYPDVDFIFRPHPLLKYNLTKYWGENKTNKYYDQIAAYSNAIYDTSEDYLDTFANSDAMIHDCGSFTAEYLFVNKPCCYMLKNSDDINKMFLPMGQKCLDNYYKAFNKDDILNFIDNVVIKGIDPMKSQRDKFLQELRLNYPNAGKRIVEYIKQEIVSVK